MEAESEKLKYEHLKIKEENRDLVNQNHKLCEEVAYAKELASSAAVELKNLAGEVTKLSVQNSKQAKELLIAQEMAHSRVPGRKGLLGAGRGKDEVGTWSLDLEDMKMELQDRKQREAALEAALAEKELLEEGYKKKFDEAKKKELSLENDLAGMWVLVAKMKRGTLGISDLNVDDRSINLADITNGTKENKADRNVAVVEKQVSDDSVKSLITEEYRSPEFEPLLVRLRVNLYLSYIHVMLMPLGFMVISSFASLSAFLLVQALLARLFRMPSMPHKNRRQDNYLHIKYGVHVILGGNLKHLIPLVKSPEYIYYDSPLFFCPLAKKRIAVILMYPPRRGEEACEAKSPFLLLVEAVVLAAFLLLV
ncbi:hypothetical protein GUJ93_ZPchr0010g9577 [Zizania palustris]|uniref:Uncharacterized protein n=1 Tax=Zizania palustris TaxID=103762 RepID=A0A8J5THX8_ZIZPA|nr:hypothetical protein GUJ93_ZPchr0010g9577 [Zizania palustris]